MRKLLNILGVLTIVTTTSTSVISCGNNDSRISDPSLSDKILNQLNLNINNSNYKDFGTLTNRQIWDSNKDTIQNLIFDELNHTIASMIYNSTMNERNNIVHESDHKDIINNYFNTTSDDLAANNLYEEYSNDYNTGTYLENQIFSKGYNTDVQSTDWYVPGTISNFWKIKDSTDPTAWKNFDKWTNHTNDDTSGDNIVKINDIADSDFDHMEKQGQKFDYWKSKFNAGGAESTTQLKKDLEVRFQSYMHNEIKPNIWRPLLVTDFLQKNEFNVEKSGSENKYTINKYNKMFNTWQSWQQDQWRSNIKMVWQVNVNTDNYTDFNNWYNNYDKTNPGGWAGINTVSSFINAFKEHPEDLKIQFGGDNKLGNDPVFGQKGFEGMFGITPGSDLSKAGTIFTSNSSNEDISIYKDQLTIPGAGKNAPGPGLLNNAGHYYWTNDDNSGYTFAFSLPVYPLDLINYDNNGKEGNPGISYTPYLIDKSEKMVHGISAGNLGDEWDAEPHAHSSEVEGLNYVQKQNLFSMIENTIATDGLSADGSSDSGVAIYALEAIYSYAFNYNPENIYTSDLYSKIGKYILKND